MAGTPKYDREAITAEVCLRLAEGEALRQICTDPHMPTVGGFLFWCAEDAGIADRYARAKALGLDVLADEMLHIADTPQIGQKTTSKATGLEITEGDMVEHRRLQVDTRKWLLSKLAPKKYGDKQQVELSGKVDVAGTLTAARKRSGLG